MSGETITAVPPDYGVWFFHTNELYRWPAPWWFVLARNLGHAGWKAANHRVRKYRRYGEQSARQQLADLGRRT